MEIVFPVFRAQRGLQQEGTLGRIPGLLAGHRGIDLGVTFLGPQRPKNGSQQRSRWPSKEESRQGVPLGLAPGPGKGLTSTPGPWEPHKASWELQEARTRILARQALLPGTMPAIKKSNERAQKTSFVIPFAHSIVSKRFGKAVFTATLKSRPCFP